MRMEWWILLVAYVVTTSLLFLTPKNKIRVAIVAFLFNQTITLLLGLIVVEFGALEYPVRFFKTAYHSSFTFEFYVFPVSCALFNARYPSNKSGLAQFRHYVAYSSTLTIIEVLIEKNVNLIRYIHWDWYVTWISLAVTFYITRVFCVWFFADNKFSGSEKKI